MLHRTIMGEHLGPTFVARLKRALDIRNDGALIIKRLIRSSNYHKAHSLSSIVRKILSSYSSHSKSPFEFEALHKSFLTLSYVFYFPVIMCLSHGPFNHLDIGWRLRSWGFGENDRYLQSIYKSHPHPKYSLLRPLTPNS